MNICEVKNYMLQFNCAQRAQVTGNVQVSQGLQFSNITHFVNKEGFYTPNEDYEYLWNNIPPAESPNFIFIQTPTFLNISVNVPGQGVIVAAVPVNKVFQLCLPASARPNAIYIEGRTGNSYIPMPQNVQISYFAFMLRADF